jgi:hypothetical protein
MGGDRWGNGLKQTRSFFGGGIVAVSLGLALAGCVQQPSTGTMAYPPAPRADAAGTSKLPASTLAAPRPFSPGAPTGTYVGKKVLQLRGDLQTMQRGLSAHSQQLRETQGTTTQHAERYHGLVAGINARLQIGTTRGNPILTSQLSESQGQLAYIDADLARLSQLAGRVSTDSALAGYLLEAVRAAYNLSGAVDEDHRQLAILEDQVNRTVILIDRLLTEINTDINRQTAYVGRERRNVTTLALAVKNGEAYGGNLGLVASQGRPGSLANTRAVGRTPADRPLVVIRFDRPTVEYEQPLYRAVSEALERRPFTSFEIEAAAPSNAASPASARRQANRVTRTLIDMGVPRDRLFVSERLAGDAQTDEVRIYIR